METYEVRLMPILDVFAKVGGVAKSLAIFVIIVSFFNKQFFHGSIIQNIFVEPSSSDRLFARQEIFQNFKERAIIKKYLCCCCRFNRKNTKEIEAYR